MYLYHEICLKVACCGVLTLLGLAISIYNYFKIPLRFSTTYFSTGGPVPPKPPLKLPMPQTRVIAKSDITS